MPEVFADTGYWIALLNDRDSLHAKARELSETFSAATIVTTEMVLTELLNHASGGGSQKRRLAAEAVRDWMVDPDIAVVPPDQLSIQGCPGALHGAAGSKLERGGLRKFHRHGSTPNPGSSGL